MPEKYNYLAAAEMMAEQNYNQIDGIMNNTKEPTFEERMKAATEKAKEHNNKRAKRHKTDRHRQDR